MPLPLLAALVLLALTASVTGCGAGGGSAGGGSAGGGSAGGGSGAPAPASSSASPAGAGHGATSSQLRGRITHVWIIELENSSFQTSFGDPAADPELARVLPARGALLRNYYGIGHDSLDNYIAQISGQAPTAHTQADCGTFSRFTPSGPAGQYGQLPGNGCVYPASVPTIGSELSAAHLTWKAYNQQMGNAAGRDGTVATAQGPACGHPQIGAPDPTDRSHPANDSYATRHDPFVYFQGIIGDARYCAAHVVSFQPLAADLRTASTTPAYSWITPDTCSDGHDPTCSNGAPGGLGQVDAFLTTWVPRIMASPAYRAGGLIIITTDESNAADATACCGEGTIAASHPNASAPGQVGPGGGRVGAVLLSPFIRPGTVSSVPYNHFSMLKSVDEIFGLPLIGDARLPQVHAFGADVFTR